MFEGTESAFQYTEYWDGRTGLTFGVREVLFSERSDFQKVEVLDTDVFGRLLTLDGVVMFSERDEFVYHEMIIHPALTLHGAARRVLIVGGGDGGAAREALKHGSVERVDLVDIDGMVVDVAKRFFPTVASSFEDERLALHVADGIEFVREAADGAYDVVVVDSTDPVGVAEGLFTEAFYRDCRRLLTDRGLITVQSESPFDPRFAHAVGRARLFFERLFPVAATHLAFIPTYPTGMWSFTTGSMALDPVADFDPGRAAAYLERVPGRRYYDADLHRAAYALPVFVQEMLAEARREA